ncbi:hypothetical protein [Sulfuricurvum sp.]|uniref:hypothetical protein n=1 Tax=Sulfuricurvum sp. TaxID=2025608 RepID=UPI0026087B45|nr:hypothetical protein [Sulfuricurvum sp.]MDD2267023.1 hypothetical protein [Sulfuricurvum sp.]MDD2782639.1 hypothetical protein [Sulfuricurvum sp.]
MIYTRPPIVDEVIVKKERVIYATVNVPLIVVEGDEYFIGKVLSSTDGGQTFDAIPEAWVAGSYDSTQVVSHNNHTFTSLIDFNDVEPGTDPLKWEDNGVWDANGILIENIDVTGMASVMITGVAVENKLLGYDSAMRHTLFKNKITMQ